MRACVSRSREWLQGAALQRPLKSRFQTSVSLGLSPIGADKSRDQAKDTPNLPYVSYENPQNGKAQTPLLIQHGLFGRKENFKHLGKQFHHITRRDVLIPDVRPGTLENSPRTPHKPIGSRYEEMSQDLVHFLTQLGLNKVSVLGYGTGGRVAMYMALIRPDLVGKLIVVSTSPLNTPLMEDRWKRTRDAIFLLSELLQAHGLDPSGTVNTSLDGVELKLDAYQALKEILTDKNERALFLSNIGKVPVQTLLNQSANLGTFPEMTGEVFHGPTLFVTGERDTAWQHDHEVRGIRQLFPNSHFAKIRNAARYPHCEASNEFLATTAAFLQASSQVA